WCADGFRDARAHEVPDGGRRVRWGRRRLTPRIPLPAAEAPLGAVTLMMSVATSRAAFAVPGPCGGRGGFLSSHFSYRILLTETPRKDDDVHRRELADRRQHALVRQHDLRRHAHGGGLLQRLGLPAAPGQGARRGP